MYSYARALAFVLCLSMVAVEILVAGEREAMAETEPLIKDSFPGGKPELLWVPYPHFNHDNLRGSGEETSPEGQPGIGVLDNKNAGGFAALSYVEGVSLRDFYLETWMYAEATAADKGPLNGIAFRIDPTGGNFYRLAAQFTSEPRISLAYVGKDTNHFPDYLIVWTQEKIPGGAPREGKWHKVAIQVYAHKAEVYWNDVKLPGGPFTVDRVHNGYVGVYANVVGGFGIAETKIDSFRVWAGTPGNISQKSQDSKIPR